MRKSTPVLFSLSVLLILTQACGVPNFPAPTQDLNVLGTAIMSTMIVGATQTALAGITPTPLISASPLISPTPFPTFTPEPPTATPSATLSPTPVFTATSTVPLISVSVATNCRVGPGRVYDRVGALLVGQVAEVFGRNLNGNYWYIRNPNNSSGFCWLWGEYATVTGNFAALPVFTPPPTPTPVPNFKARYAKLETCNNRWWVDIRLDNTGGAGFQSISLTVRDLRTNVVVSMSSDIFQNIDGCTKTTSRDALRPDGARVVSGPAFTYNPAGHRLRATIVLCTREEQKGMCIQRKITFRP